MKINTIIRGGHQIGTVTKDGALTTTIYLTLTADLERTPEQIANLAIISDVLTAGAGTLDRNAFLKAGDELGSNIAVSASDNSITITVTALKAKLDQTLKLTTLMLTKPTLDPSEVKRARLLYKTCLNWKKKTLGVLP